MAANMRGGGGVINVVVLAILVCFLITIFQAASAESHEKKPDKAVEKSKEAPVEKKVEGAADTAPWDKVKSWASKASESLPKSFSFKKAAPASQDSHGTGETVKGTTTKGYETGKKATQDGIENTGQAAKKVGEKIKQTAGKGNGEL
ncbi:hypothetical protein NBB33_23700 [Salmonella sp. NW1189]|uniref:hypothetical protein n=1 Tax=Salmonella sp. NW1189 TaxID=2947625 RepID=UPI003F466F58